MEERLKKSVSNNSIMRSASVSKIEKKEEDEKRDPSPEPGNDQSAAAGQNSAKKQVPSISYFPEIYSLSTIQQTKFNKDEKKFILR